MAKTLYEVNIEVESQIYDRYLDWLKDHVAEMLRLPGFLRAEISDVEDLQNPQSKGRSRLLSVSYELESRDALELYFRTHAQRMRQDALDRWGAQFNATRRLKCRVV